jgi:hypothetical protein
MVGDVATTSADWVTGSAVGAEDTSVAVEQSKVLSGTGVLLLVRAVEDVVGLVGGVHHITPDKSGGNLDMLV